MRRPWVKSPASYDRVDVTEYAKRKLAPRGIEEKVRVEEEVTALLEIGPNVPGFQISAQFLE
jgi:hypothetical protein